MVRVAGGSESWTHSGVSLARASGAGRWGSQAPGPHRSGGSRGTGMSSLTPSISMVMRMVGREVGGSCRA